MASLTGTVTGASTWKDLSTGNLKTTITITVSHTAGQIDIGDASKLVDHTAPRQPVSIVGRAITITTDGSNHIQNGDGTTGIIIGA